MIEIALIAAGAFALLKRPSAPQPAAQPQPAPAPAPEQQSNALQELLPVGGIAAAAAAASAASSELAGAITNTPLARTIGAIGPVGVTAVAGARVGEELDKMITGGMDSTTSGIAQGGTAFVAVSAVVFGPVFILGAGVNAALTYTIGALIQDAIRLAGGQKMAAEEYAKKWQQTYDRIRDQLKLHGYSDEMAHREAVPFTDGFCIELNRQAYRRWMRGPKGLGNTDAFHEEWGRDRGYFVGSGWPGDNKDFLKSGEPVPKSIHNTYFASIPKHDLVATQVGQRVPFWIHPFTKQKVYVVPAGFTWSKLGKPIFGAPRNWLDPAGYEFKTVTHYKDARREGLQQKGHTAAVVQAYVEWMRRAWGLGFNAKSHLQVGIKEGGVYSGVQVQDDGAIVWEGTRYFWKDFK